MKSTVAALVLALAGVIGSLFLTLGMGLKTCPLCFYQRSFIMVAAAVLAVGMLADRSRGPLYCLVCLPVTLAGLGVAGFQEYQILSGVLECPKGLFGFGTAPAQSLGVFIALTAAVASGAEWRPRLIASAIVVGALMAWGSIASAPPDPIPDLPNGQNPQSLKVCRPLFPSP